MFDRLFRIFSGGQMGNDDALGAGLQRVTNVMSLVFLYPDNTDGVAGLCRPDQILKIHVASDGSVFRIDEQPIKTSVAQHLHDNRTSAHHGTAANQFAPC